MRMTTSTASSRHRLGGILAGLMCLALILAACGNGTEPGEAEDAEPAGAEDAEPVGEEEAEAAPAADDTVDSLTILEWAGYEDESFYPLFIERHPDVTLDFQFGDSDADFLTKVQAGGVSPSLVHPCAGWVGLWQNAGLAQPLDTSLLSNWETLDENMRELGEIDGEYYFAPYDWGYTSIVVNTERVDNVPTSWKDLWEDEYAGRYAIWDDPEEAVVMTAYAWGLDPYDMDDDDLALVREKLEELHAGTKTYWEGVFELNQLMIDGEVDMAQAWTETYAALVEEGIEAEYVDPEEGRLGWVCGFIVLDEPGTASYELAHEYIDAMLDPSGGLELVNQWYYGHSNLETIEQADEYVVDLIELDRLDLRERTNFYEPLTEEQRETWARMWSEVTAG
jgi:spermidine/putrescine transport system substrate-binding protein